MKTKHQSIIIGVIALLLLAAGAAGALPRRSAATDNAVLAPVSSGINYQGRLTNPGGAPLTGTYTMRFVVYDAAVAGTALWDSGNLNMTVEKGLFNVQLGVDQTDFDGQALWLSIIVEGQTLSPRQEILPAPYALSLRPGADIVGEPATWNESILDVALTGTWPLARAAGFYAPSTGTAVYADANGGTGIFGDSENSVGVWGSSNSSWGGYFTSESGHGIRVDTNSPDHYDFGAYITANGGYAVYAQSSGNMGVRGEAGDVTGIAQPLGPVGVVGIGTSRGTYGSSDNGSGVYGNSDLNYGVWGYSNAYRGVTGRTSRVDNNYGFYTPDNLYSLNYNLAGSIMQVMQNGGTAPLSPGDVVVFSGINRAATAVGTPIVQVSKADDAHSTAVAGVVYSRFNIDALNPDLEFPDDKNPGQAAALEVTPAGDAAAGDYVLVVVQGPALVNVSATAGEIAPGDLLSASQRAGLAGKALMVSLDGVETAVPGTVFGKALEALDGTRDTIYVYVTLQ